MENCKEDTIDKTMEENMMQLTVKESSGTKEELTEKDSEKMLKMFQDHMKIMVAINECYRDQSTLENKSSFEISKEEIKAMRTAFNNTYSVEVTTPTEKEEVKHKQINEELKPKPLAKESIEAGQANFQDEAPVKTSLISSKIPQNSSSKPLLSQENAQESKPKATNEEMIKPSKTNRSQPVLVEITETTVQVNEHKTLAEENIEVLQENKSANVLKEIVQSWPNEDKRNANIEDVKN